jgi:hypothetical protein
MTDSIYIYVYVASEENSTTAVKLPSHAKLPAVAFLRRDSRNRERKHFNRDEILKANVSN